MHKIRIKILTIRFAVIIFRALLLRRLWYSKKSVSWSGSSTPKGSLRDWLEHPDSVGKVASSLK